MTSLLSQPAWAQEIFTCTRCRKAHVPSCTRTLVYTYPRVHVPSCTRALVSYETIVPSCLTRLSYLRGLPDYRTFVAYQTIVPSCSL